MEKPTKKELKEHYKNRIITGGVFCIKCSGNGHIWIRSTKDIEGQKNKYEFFASTNYCPEPSMNSEWNQYGAKSFTFTILDEITKGEAQTDREFTEDIDILLKMWVEKLQQDELK